MIDEYTRQCDVAPISSQSEDDSLLERLKKMTNKIKRATKDKKRTRTQAKNS